MYYYTKCNMAVSYKTQEPCTLWRVPGFTTGFWSGPYWSYDMCCFFSFFFFAFLCVFCLSSSTQCWLCLDCPSSFDCVLTVPPVLTVLTVPPVLTVSWLSLQFWLSWLPLQFWLSWLSLQFWLCLDCPSSFDCVMTAPPVLTVSWLPLQFWLCLDYPSSFDCVLTAPPVFSNVYIPYLEKKNRRSIQQQISICNQKKKSCNLLMKKPIPKQTDTMLLLVFWWKSLSVTYNRLMAFSGYSGFLYQ